MRNETQDRVTRLMKLYLSRNKVDQCIIIEFRAWFESEGHTEEKYRALQELYEIRMQFDKNPSADLIESFNKICRKLNLPEIGHIEPVEPFNKKHGNLWPGKYRHRKIAVSLMSFAIISACIIAILIFHNDITSSTYYLKMRGAENTVIAEENRTGNTTQIFSENLTRNMLLPDSSNIWINKNSVLEFDENFANHRVVSLKGEAFFDVAKQNGQSFVVETNGIKTIVTGTSFNVQSYPESSGIVISLYEGSLKVECSEKYYDLTAGQILEYEKGCSTATIRTTHCYMPKWLTEVIQFENIKVGEIFDKLQEVYGVPIIVQDEILTEELLTVCFEQGIALTDLMDMLSRISSRFTHVYDKKMNSILILAK